MHHVTYICTYTNHTQMCAYVYMQFHGYTLESKNGFLKQKISLGSVSLSTVCNSMLTATDTDGFVPQERELL